MRAVLRAIKSSDLEAAHVLRKQFDRSLKLAAAQADRPGAYATTFELGEIDLTTAEEPLLKGVLDRTSGGAWRLHSAFLSDLSDDGLEDVVAFAMAYEVRRGQAGRITNSMLSRTIANWGFGSGIAPARRAMRSVA